MTNDLLKNIKKSITYFIKIMKLKRGLFMKKSRLLDKIPISIQNPLLGTHLFFNYCKKRFKNIGMYEKDFLWLLNFYKKEGLFLPVYSVNKKDYYSTFQVYNLYLLEKYRSNCLNLYVISEQKNKKIKVNVQNWKETLKVNKDILKGKISCFNKLLLLLLKIQDFYLPEVRGNQCFGEWHDYKNMQVIDKVYFIEKSGYLLSFIRKHRENKIKNEVFKPKKILSDSKPDIKTIKDWMCKLAVILKDVDPLEKWYLFIKYFKYNKRQYLKGSALIAQDFYEIYNILSLFLQDLGENLLDEGISDVFDWTNGSKRDEKSKLPFWKENLYGKGVLNNPYQMLEFLSNEFGVNPKPRAIVFTEGKEWKAISKLFELYNFNPNLLGVEFRSISGEGNFSLSNWQCFIEYMHEKNILIYFILDNEGHVANEARKLLNAKRKFEFPGLEDVIPTKDRIKIWGKRKKNASFEEVNFTDFEIARAINKQLKNINIKSKEIRKIRNNLFRRKGLIEEIKIKFNIKLNKPQLDMNLVENLIKKRKLKPNVKNKRPLEKVVLKIGKKVLLSHQPTSKYHQNKLFKTGLMG